MVGLIVSKPTFEIYCFIIKPILQQVKFLYRSKYVYVLINLIFNNLIYTMHEGLNFTILRTMLGLACRVFAARHITAVTLALKSTEFPHLD